MATQGPTHHQRTELVTVNPVYALLAVHGPQVDLLADVREFFDDCHTEQRRPILQTDPHATLGPFVVSWLRALSGYWVTRGEAGALREVQTGAVVTDPIELFENRTSIEEPPEDAFSHAAIMLEVVLEHRPEPATTLGDVVPLALSALGATPPHAWGSHEPLSHAWDVRALTEHARTEMPLTGPIFWRSDDGYGELAAARTQEGLVERSRIAVAHDGPPRDGLRRVRDAVEALVSSRLPVMTCAASAIGAYPDLRTRPQPAPPERPLAAMLGPTVLGRLGWSAAEVATSRGGQLIGRAKVPGVVVTFDGDLDDARQRYLELVAG